MLFKRQISDLDKRIIFEKPVKTPNGQGGFVTTWAVACTVWGRILPTSAKEQRQSDQTVLTISHTISIRHRRDVKSSWRIRYKNRFFSIVGLVNPEENSEWVDVLVKEVAG
jgi:SPP1 family predicted phage head-tail adaptor